MIERGSSKVMVAYAAIIVGLSMLSGCSSSRTARDVSWPVLSSEGVLARYRFLHGSIATCMKRSGFSYTPVPFRDLAIFRGQPVDEFLTGSSSETYGLTKMFDYDTSAFEAQLRDRAWRDAFQGEIRMDESGSDQPPPVGGCLGKGNSAMVTKFGNDSFTDPRRPERVTRELEKLLLSDSSSQQALKSWRQCMKADGSLYDVTTPATYRTAVANKILTTLESGSREVALKLENQAWRLDASCQEASFARLRGHLLELQTRAIRAAG
jgi:hypothetical protein